MNNHSIKPGIFSVIPFLLRRVFLAMFLLPLSLAVAGNEFRQIPHEEKIQDKDLTFCVTFDNFSVNADFAKGNPNSTTLPNLALGLRGVLGFDGVNAFRPGAEEDLKFDAQGNVLPHCGTITLWVNALDYSPSEELTDGKKRGNIGLLHLMFKQGLRSVEYHLYEFADNVYFDWRNSEPPHDYGQIAQAQVSRKGIKQKQWHQLAVTYDERKIAIYLNGVLGAEKALPEKVAKTLDLQPDSKLSFLGITSRFFDDKHQWGVAVDDVKVYSRVMSALEIKNQYQKLLAGESAANLQSFEVKLNGVDEGKAAKLDQIEAEFDFSVLPDAERKRLAAGTLEIGYKLTGPGGFSNTGSWTMQKPGECRRMSGIVAPGRYHLEASMRFSDGRTETNSADIDVPDLSFVANGIGDDDTVPKIWSAFAVKERATGTLWERIRSFFSPSAGTGVRTVTLWNRVYSFGTGPLPTGITVYGKPLLEKAPELVIETAAGKSDVKYTAGKTTRTNRAVTFTGTGTASGFTLDYATTVEFDGMIKFDFVIKGEPEIKSMRLAWQVKPENCQYLMTPLLQEKKGPEFAFKYPGAEMTADTQLWLVTEGKGGFAYTMANDANWVYDPSSPVFKVNKATGTCSVDMVTKTVKMPPETPYQALFIATPTRPLPERVRVIRHGDGSRSDAPRLRMNGGEGLTGQSTYQPDPAAFALTMKNVIPGTVGVYGMADELTTGTPIANYFTKYWDIPGYIVVNMPYNRLTENGTFKKELYPSVPACNATHIKDYYLRNMKELLEQPYSDRIWMIYYDLCGNVLCSNPCHGCGFKDKFGRAIRTFAVLNKRKLIERTVSLCHAKNKVVMLHAQRLFSPFMHGLADYYFPGEQHNGLLMRNPYGYTDELSDALYRSEYNRDVLGVGVIFLTALGQANIAYCKDPVLTEAMMSMLLAHDVEPDPSYSNSGVHVKVWNILEKYQVQSPKTKVHYYYNQDAVTSSNPEARVTYYECPDNQYVLAVTNKDIAPKKTVLDLSKLKAGDYTVCEEYKGTDIPVKNGTLEITIPPRSFRLIAFPPKSSYPVVDDCSKTWGSWNSDGAKVAFLVDKAVGHQNPGSLMIQVSADTPDKSAFCFAKKFPVKAGKTYRAKVFARSQDLPPGAKITLAFQGQDANGLSLGLPPQSADLAAPSNDKWEELNLTFKIPTMGKWADARNLLVTLAVRNTKGGKAWFDDFELSETE
jgi:hypothetical protein